MANNKYQRGEMNIDDQKATWKGFIVGTVWSSLILILVVFYSTLTIAVGVHWVIVLLLSYAFGLGMGYLLDLGMKWIATLIGLTVLAVVIQFFVGVFLP